MTARLRCAGVVPQTRGEIKRQTGKEVWLNAALVFANAFLDMAPSKVSLS
jgi:hypothetical protein